MDPVTMIVLTVGLSCGGAERLCRVFVEPAATRGVPALSSTSTDPIQGAGANHECASRSQVGDARANGRGVNALRGR
jgi:hypothetical protein